MPFESKYDPSYPQLFIDICKAEGSICDFCAQLEIARGTFYNWTYEYPEMKRAFDLGKEITESFLTREGIRGMKMGKDFNATAWSILMRNKCSYVEHRKVGINFTGCDTPEEKMKLLDERVMQGRLTPREAKDIAEYIKISAEIHEKSQLAQDVKDLKEMVSK